MVTQFSQKKEDNADLFQANAYSYENDWLTNST